LLPDIKNAGREMEGTSFPSWPSGKKTGKSSTIAKKLNFEK
jgi:hypothetical protein